MKDERKPLLSVDEMIEVAWREDDNGNRVCWTNTMSPAAVRDFYEAKITSGELRTNEVFHPVLKSSGSHCARCDAWLNVAYERFCPQCGVRIT